MGTLILLASLGLQLLAAGLAIRLIWTTRAVWAWVLIAGALVLMTGRRAITLAVALSGGAHVSISAEVVALLISVSLVVGVALIRPLFERMQRMASALAEREAALQRELIERRELEAQMVNAQKMEAIGRISGGVAHDFNNMLTVIMASADLAGFEPTANAAIRTHLRTIQETAQRAARLTNQLLSFARRQPVEPTLFDLGEVVRSIAPMLRSLMGDRVVLEVPSEAPAWVEADRGQIEQVLLNLAMNARDAMPEGGTFQIGIRPALPLAEIPEHVLWLTDTGVGMNAETCARIFEPFFTTKAPGLGTGLGLASAYGIVGRAGGRIEVASRESKGTTFSIYLPPSAGRGQTAQSTPNDSVPLGGRAEVILLVEDEPDLRAIMSSVLTDRGYKVLVAKDGEAALERISQSMLLPDLLLTDLVMPRMDGRLLAARVRVLFPTIRVLFMTGHVTDEATFPQAETVLRKPFSMQTLCAQVRATLDHAGA